MTRAACIRLLPVVMLFGSQPAMAEWRVIDHRDASSGAVTTIASTTNPDGYTLEMYRDAGGAVRSRFTLMSGLTRLHAGACPTFQIDRGPAVNRSVDNAPCLATGQWAEFVLGYVSNSQVVSPRLLSFMNGNSISFRFRLAGGDYRDTLFSLLGSKRSMAAAIGSDVSVTAR
jgi:YD repeat-containing protein